VLTLLEHHSRSIHTNLLVHLYHGASEGVYPPNGTPHTVSSQTVMENSPEVCAVHCLELVIIRVAAGGEEGRKRRRREREERWRKRKRGRESKKEREGRREGTKGEEKGEEGMGRKGRGEKRNGRKGKREVEKRGGRGRDMGLIYNCVPNTCIPGVRSCKCKFTFC